MEKKIRVTLPKRILDILTEDMEEFKIKKNTLLNYIFENLKMKFSKEGFKYSGESGVVQFNLNKKNKEYYYEFLLENGIQNESEFFREICIIYGEQSRKDRELFLFKELVERLKIATKEKKRIKITFQDGRETTVEPYFLGASKLELSNYIFCYNLDEDKWKNYKLKYVDKIYITKNKFMSRDEKFVESIRKDFDPFLSKGKKVIIKLTDNGEKIFKTIRVNRPKILNKKENLYELECSQEKAKRYFTFFLDEVEILEPKELREWFRNKLKKAYEQYK